MLTDKVLARWPGSPAAKVTASSQPVLEQKVHVVVISRISYLVMPRYVLFNYYGHAILGGGFPERSVCRHINGAGTD